MTAGFPWRLVTVDIDGTLTRVHGWYFLAQCLGRTDRFERSQGRFSRGEIGEEEHLRNLLSIAEGESISDIHALLEATPRLTGIGPGVQELRARGAQVALLTHNPEYVAEWYRARFGFDGFEGTHQPVEAGRVGSARDVRPDKANGLARLEARYQVPPNAVVHVGDGTSDAALFPRIGGGIALNSLRPEVRAAADVALASGDFRAVVVALDRLRPKERGRVNDAPRGPF